MYLWLLICTNICKQYLEKSIPNFNSVCIWSKNTDLHLLFYCIYRSSLGIPWQSSGLDYTLSLLWAMVQSLIKELRSHKLGSKTNKQIQISLSYDGVHHKVQLSSVSQSCPTLCDPMNCSTPDLLVHHQLPEFTQTHVHQVSDAIQPSHPLSPPSPPAPNPSQHQSLFQWVNSSHEVAKVREVQL